MRDVNSTLRKKIFEMLSVIPDTPVYYKYLPSTVDSNAYILITTINSNDSSNMHAANTDTTIQIGIYTKDNLAASGVNADTIAEGVYEILYSSPGSRIDLSPNFQNCSLRLVNDVSPDAIQTNNFILINRFITFRLNISNHH